MIFNKVVFMIYYLWILFSYTSNRILSRYVIFMLDVFWKVLLAHCHTEVSVSIYKVQNEISSY